MGRFRGKVVLEREWATVVVVAAIPAFYPYFGRRDHASRNGVRLWNDWGRAPVSHLNTIYNQR